MNGIETIAWGILGGIGAEAAVFFALRYRPAQKLPYWLKSKTYYLIAGVMAIFGGLVALAYVRSGVAMNPMMAIQIGASTPLILRKLGEGTELLTGQPDPQRVD